jgi:hypothetical protein
MGGIMASKPDQGVKGALQLDQAASDLEKGRAAAAEKAAGEQMMLFADRSVFGTLRDPESGTRVQQGPGRPRGSTNRTTRDLVKLIERTGRHPVLAMAEIVATPIDVIAATLGCKKIEAAEYHRKVMSDLAPYVAQKLPTAIQIEGANAGMLVINLGGAAGEQHRLGLQLADAARQAVLIEHEENQALSDDEDAPSHDDASHDEGK